jgi:hypothetical protein
LEVEGDMKQALVLAIATFSLTAAAYAQAPDTDISPGPHNPNPPMESPDLRLPAPCAPTANLAGASAPTKPGAIKAAKPPVNQITPVDSAGDTQCSAGGVPQSAALPGLATPAH